MGMVKGITSTGFEYEVNENIKEDWRLVKAIAMAEGDDEGEQVRGYASLVSLILGNDGEKRLCSHVEKEGIVNLKDINSELKEILSSLRKDDQLKK